MRTRIYFAAILLFVTFLVYSLPALCEDAATPAPAASDPPVAVVETQPAPPAAAVPAAPEETTVPVAPVPVIVPSPEPAPPIAPVVAFPPVTPDTDIFQRTPRIDGVVEDGEWDTFYAIKHEDVDFTTYADWDAGSLHFAVKSSRPVDMLAIVDARADGWYNGDDNYEFRAIRDGDSVKLVVNRYDSKRTKTPTAAPVTAEEVALVTMKSGAAPDGATCIEMSIPASMVPGLKLGSGRKIGLLVSARTGADEMSWVASGSAGDVRESVLVNKKIASLKPLQLGFDLLDAKIARGEELVGKFHLTNAGADTVPVYSFVIAGEGKSGEYLSSHKIRMEGLAPKKHISQEVRSVIPRDMPLGSWALGAEVKSIDGKLGGALVSFEVVEPFGIQLTLPTKPVLTTAKDVTLGVVVRNNKRHEVRGEAKITLPAGWELWKNEDKRDLRAHGEGLTTVAFKTKPPLGVLGMIPVKFDVTIDGKTVSAEGAFEMVNPVTP